MDTWWHARPGSRFDTGGAVPPRTNKEHTMGENIFDKAKDALGGAEGVGGKVKDLATDENIDKAAAAIKEHTPDKVDAVVDALAEKAKQAND